MQNNKNRIQELLGRATEDFLKDLKIEKEISTTTIDLLENYFEDYLSAKKAEDDEEEILDKLNENIYDRYIESPSYSPYGGYDESGLTAFDHYCENHYDSYNVFELEEKAKEILYENLDDVNEEIEEILFNLGIENYVVEDCQPSILKDSLFWTISYEDYLNGNK